MVHDLLKDMLRRVTDLERRANNVMRPAKVVDIDEENWRVRVQYSLSDAQGGGGGSAGGQQPVISTWIPWTEERAGNKRTWNPPTVGEQVHLYSPSGEIGQHSWLRNGGFTTKEGEQTKSKAFKPSHNKRDEYRDTIEVIEDKNQLQPSTQPPAQDKGSGPKDKIYSRLNSGEARDTYLAQKKEQQEQDKQHSHEEGWKQRRKGTNVYTSHEQSKTTSEDVDSKKLFVTDQTANRKYQVAQDQQNSNKKVTEAGRVETTTKDGGDVKGKTGNKGILPDELGAFQELWDGAQNNGTGQNEFKKLQTTKLNRVKGKTPGADYMRSAWAGKYTRFTQKSGGSSTTVSQDGGKHDINNDKSVSRQTQDYRNNALGRSVQHGGGGMQLSSGGGMGISSGGGMSIASGGGLKLAGHGVNIGGPVSMSKSFIGWGISAPMGGGTGFVDSNGMAVDVSGDLLPQDIVVPDNPSEDPDDFPLGDLLDADPIDNEDQGGEAGPADTFDVDQRMELMESPYRSELLDVGFSDFFGDMTENGGLEAPFEVLSGGETENALAESAVKTAPDVFAYVGATLLEPSRITKLRVRSPTDAGSASGDHRLELWAKEGVSLPPQHPEDGVFLGSTSKIDATKTGWQSIASNDAETAFDHVWVVVRGLLGSGSFEPFAIGNIEMFTVPDVAEAADERFNTDDRFKDVEADVASLMPLNAKPAFYVHKNGSNQTGVSENNTTQVTFSTEVFDIGGHFDSNAWTPPAGIVTLTANVRITANSDNDGTVATIIRKNGAAIAESLAVHTIDQDDFGVSVSVVDKSDGDDVYDVAVLLSSVGILGTATLSGVISRTNFSGAWLGPAN